MIYLFLIAMLLLIWVAYEILSAPFGYENETGFHLGKPETDISLKGSGEQQRTLDNKGFIKDSRA